MKISFCSMICALFAWFIFFGSFGGYCVAQKPLAEDLKKTMTLDFGKGVKIELVLIQPGSFMMGDENGREPEKPAHKVTITKPFYMCKYEVTQEQWEALMGNNPSKFKGPKNPVEKVSWEDCQAFLKKLNEKFGAGGTKFSLPTEAQWEYACRAGSTTKYSFGDNDKELGDYAWLASIGGTTGNAGDKTHPVGEKKPNAWGLYDMHGNVCEWCADWYGLEYYPQSPAEDPAGPSSSNYTAHVLQDRVVRGGSWFVFVATCNSAHRYNNSPTSSNEWTGFRVVCAP